MGFIKITQGSGLLIFDFGLHGPETILRGEITFVSTFSHLNIRLPEHVSTNKFKAHQK